MNNGQAATAEMRPPGHPKRASEILRNGDLASSGSDTRSLRLLSHTHWDREWYLTLEQYRVRLIEVMDRALANLAENKEFHHFHADSQTILIHDYLAVRPSQEGKLRAAFREGKMSSGPFYVLNDEYLCSGEAWVENLLFGAEDCARFGAECSRVCYVVDNFGHISQLPQIATQFGLKYFYGIRGWPFQETHRSEFLLEGPDGSHLLAVRHPWGYGLFRELAGDKAHIRGKLEAALEKLTQLAHETSPILLMNGIDHAAPPENMDEIMAVVREFDPLARQVSLDDYFVELEDSLPAGLEIKKGESRFVPGLYDVLSSRMPQKLLYERARMWLEDRLDPLLGSAVALGQPIADDHRKFLWRKFLENLPHDSICGCSMDEVHQDIQRRLEGCIEGVETVFLRTFDRLVNGSETPNKDLSGRLLIFNPLPHSRNEIVEATLSFPEEDKVFHWSLIDESGRDIPFQLLGTEQFVKRLPSEYDVPARRSMLHARIAIQVSLVPLGITSLRVIPRAGRDGLFSAIYGTEKHDTVLTKLRAENISPAHGVLENSLVRAELEPFGTWRIIHKETGQILSRQNLFEHAPDLGDLYKRGQLPADPRTTSDGALRRVTLEQNGPLLACYALEFGMEVPVGVKDDHSGMRDELVTLKIVSRATLRKDSACLELETTIFNSARDHEVRVLFPVSADDPAVFSDSIFDVIERPPMRESFVLRQPYLQTYENARSHNKEFVDLSSEAGGFAIFSTGLQEHQVQRGTQSALALTLLRAVGWIYRESMGETRTPEAQCLGEMTARYGIYPHAGGWQGAGVKRMAREFSSGVFTRHLFDPGTPANPLGKGLIDVNGSLHFSTLKPAHDGSGASILRLYNPSGDRAVGQVAFPGVRPARIEQAMLNEEMLSEARLDAWGLTVEAAPYEIVTFKIWWNSQS